MICVDTNIAARLIQPAHRHYSAAVNALKHLAIDEGEEFSISAHSLYELFFVLTKPLASNGFGYTAQQASVELVNVQGMFQLLAEDLGVFHAWSDLVTKYEITNRVCFDAKIVASMLENQVPRLLTFNDQDFTRFTEIATLNPFDALGIARIP